MQQVIAQVRHTLPFDAPKVQVCQGSCNGCSMKLLDYLDDELLGWEQRLDGGERPGLAELSKLMKTSQRVYRVLQKNGLISHLP